MSSSAMGDGAAHDGKSGNVEWTEPGYAETSRRDTGNQMQTDYAQNEKAKERIAAGWKDRRSR